MQEFILVRILKADLLSIKMFSITWMVFRSVMLVELR